MDHGIEAWKLLQPPARRTQRIGGRQHILHAEKFSDRCTATWRTRKSAGAAPGKNRLPHCLAELIRRRLRNKKATVGVIGLPYFGLPICLAATGRSQWRVLAIHHYLFGKHHLHLSSTARQGACSTRSSEDRRRLRPEHFVKVAVGATIVEGRFTTNSGYVACAHRNRRDRSKTDASARPESDISRTHWFSEGIGS